MDDALRATVLDEGIQAIAFFPLIGKKSLLGKFMAYWDHSHACSFEDKQLGQILVENLVTAILRIRSLEALQDSEARMRSLIESTPDAIFLKDARGRWLQANRAVLELFGLEDTDWQDKTDLELADIRPFFREVFTHCFNTDEACWQQGTLSRSEETIPRQDAAPHILDVIKVPMFSGAGKRKSLVVIGRDISERKQADARRQRLMEENSRLARQLIMAQENERKRIATELHDETGQCLTLMKMELARAASRSQDRAELTEIIHTIDATTDDIIAATRTMSHRLRPAMIDNVGLEGALKDLAASWEAQHGIACELNIEETMETLHDSIKLTVYRIAQECLMNVAAHARASHVRIFCGRRIEEHADTGKQDILTLEITDDGVGMQRSKGQRQGLGLIGIRERAHAFNGEFKLDSTPGKGTKASIRIPVSGADTA